MGKKNYLWRIVDGVLFITVSGMLVVIVIQVISRIIGRSVPWTEEMTRYLFLWTINFGMVMGMRNADHASVNIVYLLLPKSRLIERIHLVIYTASILLFFTLLTYWNIGMTLRQYRSLEISPALGIPMFLVTFPLFICNILAVMALIHSVFLDEKTKKRIILADQIDSIEMIEEGAV
jgi:TRAP-type C4-dicarboxylate transport system permease small subunit